jgi:hypothetical protein
MGERSPSRGAELQHRLETLFNDMLEQHSRLMSPETRQQQHQSFATTPSPHIISDPTPSASKPPPSALQRLKEQRIKAYKITGVNSAPIDDITTKKIEIEDINTIKASYGTSRVLPPPQDTTQQQQQQQRSHRLAPQVTPLSIPSSSSSTTTKPFLKRKSKSVVPSTLPKLDWSAVHSKIDTHRDSNTAESKMSTSRNGSTHNTPREILPVFNKNNSVVRNAVDIGRASHHHHHHQQQQQQQQQQQTTTRHLYPSSKQHHHHQAKSQISPKNNNNNNNNNNDEHGILIQEEAGPLDELLNKVDSLLLQLNKAQHRRRG